MALVIRTHLVYWSIKASVHAKLAKISLITSIRRPTRRLKDQIIAKWALKPVPLERPRR